MQLLLSCCPARCLALGRAGAETGRDLRDGSAGGGGGGLFAEIRVRVRAHVELAGPLDHTAQDVHETLEALDAQQLTRREHRARAGRRGRGEWQRERDGRRELDVLRAALCHFRENVHKPLEHVVHGEVAVVVQVEIDHRLRVGADATQCLDRVHLLLERRRRILQNEQQDLLEEYLYVYWSKEPICISRSSHHLTGSCIIKSSCITYGLCTAMTARFCSAPESASSGVA